MNKSNQIYKFSFFLIVLSTLCLNYCSHFTRSHLPPIYEDINSDEAFRLIQQNINDDEFVILDVRTPEEIENGFIDNAIFIDYKTDSFEDKISHLDKYRIYLVYCKAGIRSSKAVELMEENGFLYLYNMIDGFDGWHKNEFPIEIDN